MENVLENTSMRHSINLITPFHCKIKSQGIKLKQGRKNCYEKGFPVFLKPIWINRKPLEESCNAVYPIYSTLKEDRVQLFEIVPPLNKKGTRPIHKNFNFNQAFPRMKKKKSSIFG